MTSDSKKLMLFILAFAAAAMLIIGVLIGVGVLSGPAIEETPNQGGSVTIPIPPGDDDGLSSREYAVTLYFRFSGSGMLAGESRVITASANTRVEYAALLELISGPTYDELKRVIDSQTRIVSMREEGSVLTVTLSAEFLRQSSNLPDGWGEDTQLKEEEYLRRRLAYYSVIDTLTGLGNYSHVELLIDEDGDGIGTRVSRANFGFVDDAETTGRPMGAQPFEDSVVLSAQNTVSTVFSAILMHDWEGAFDFLSATTQSGLSRPLKEQFSSQLQERLLQLQSYQVVGEIYSANGTSAVVRVDYAYLDPEGSLVTRESAPVKLRLSGGIWKIDHDELYELF